MNNFRKREELYKKWTQMRDYININSEYMTYDRIQELRKKETEIYNEWKKLEILDKLNDKLKSNE